MNKSHMIFEQMRTNRIIALLSPNKIEDCVTAYESLSPLGITLEIAFRTDAAVEGLTAVMNKFPDALVLAGTVMTNLQAEKAIESGAAGIVSADYITSVVQTCIEKDVMCVPGGLADVGKQLTQKAGMYGCDLEELRSIYPYQWIHKLFPACTATNNFTGLAKAWKGPFKDLQIIYTGGISYANLTEISRFDLEGIFCGSALTKHCDNQETMREDGNKWLSVI